MLVSTVAIKSPSFELVPGLTALRRYTHQKTGPLSARLVVGMAERSAPVGGDRFVRHAADVGVTAVGEGGGVVASG